MWLGSLSSRSFLQTYPSSTTPKVLNLHIVVFYSSKAPNVCVGPEDAAVVGNQLSEEEKTTLQGAAVTLAELGEYTLVVSLLENLTKEKPSDPDVFRLLGEVKYKLKDYEGSANAYESAAKVSKYLSFEVLRGRANALLAAKKPDEVCSHRGYVSVFGNLGSGL